MTPEVKGSRETKTGIFHIFLDLFLLHHKTSPNPQKSLPHLWKQAGNYMRKSQVKPFPQPNSGSQNLLSGSLGPAAFPSTFLKSQQAFVICY